MHFKRKAPTQAQIKAAFRGREMPKKGAFICYKKVVLRGSYEQQDYVLRIWVPDGAKRICACGGKLRVSEAYVLGARSLQRGGPRKMKIFAPYHTPRREGFTWEIGKWHKPNKRFAGDRREECASGLHALMTFKEAREYL
jgi:hypothetical protein